MVRAFIFVCKIITAVILGSSSSVGVSCHNICHASRPPGFTAIPTERLAGTRCEMNTVAAPAEGEAEGEGEERNVNGEELEGEKEDLEDGVGENDDEFMVPGHDDVAWTGVEPVYFIKNVQRKNNVASLIA